MPTNYRNLGYPVTTRLLDWSQMVRQADGARWDLPTGKYLCENGIDRVFVEYNAAIQPQITNPLPPILLTLSLTP